MNLGRTVAAVACGGAAGALARYGLGVAFPTAPAGFPWTTLASNVVGCLLIGVLIAVAGGHALLRPLLGTGVLGGFTTFSTYILDIHRLVRAEQLPLALAYLALTVVGALAGVLAGGALATRISGRVRT
ncbi:MAG: CrcB family protein [Hamadaea sp.]|nr:CrcB family protein [Hamadaea sp.]